jgi:hypothetical protein
MSEVLKNANKVTTKIIPDMLIRRFLLVLSDEPGLSVHDEVIQMAWSL